MSELADVLLHPGRWNAVGDLSPLLRLQLALALLLLTAVAAAVAGWVTARWVRSRTQSSPNARTLELERSLQRQLVALVVFAGIYPAAEVAPLPAHADRLLTGLSFVLGAV